MTLGILFMFDQKIRKFQGRKIRELGSFVSFLNRRSDDCENFAIDMLKSAPSRDFRWTVKLVGFIKAKEPGV